MWFKHLFIFLLCLFPAWACAQLPIIQHDLSIEIDHENRTFSAHDLIKLHRSGSSRPAVLPDLSLHPRLRIESLIVDGQSAEASFPDGIIDLPETASVVEIIYGGELDQSQWPFIVWLPGDGWYPEAPDHRVRFTLSLTATPEWSALTQGIPDNLSTTSERKWIETNPQEGIFLVTGPWQRYSKTAGPIRANVMLIEPDAELAERYLDATVHYINKYSRLLGPYPYHSFTLVENVQQSGWGMPGFTLLGSRVIRLPFILHTSYPHEILHNWWGNGVYVDPTFGNWSEGLTTYLSDYRSRELRGQASQYRLNTLISWQDFAAEKEDFPLAQFRGRHDRATQAVGYGKGMFLFHMLRQKLGDELFFSGLRALYAKSKYTYTGFDDIQQVFEQTCDCTLGDFFAQWLHRQGAPKLKLDSVHNSDIGNPDKLKFRISQSSAKPWDLHIPVRVTDASGKQASFFVHLSHSSQEFDIDLDSPALRLEVDPDFDLFRTLDSDEKPTTFSSVFAADNVSVVALDPSFRAAAQSLATQHPGWELHGYRLPEKVPADTLIVLGWNQELFARWGLSGDARGYQTGDHEIEIGRVSYEIDLSRAITLVSEVVIDGRNRTVLWIATRQAEGVVDLVRRLSHYGRFSYAVFDSIESRANASGQWKPLSNTLTWENPNSDP
ncbi:MAG: M1 family metallopeptidase [bacterium]